MTEKDPEAYLCEQREKFKKKLEESKPWIISEEEGRRLATELGQRLFELRRDWIAEAQIFAESQDSTVYGVWGEQRNPGAVDYLVYKRNNQDSYFIVRSRGKEGKIRTQEINLDKTPNGVKVATVEEYTGAKKIDGDEKMYVP